MIQSFLPQFLELSLCHLDSALSISLCLLEVTSLFSICSYSTILITSMYFLIKSVLTVTEPGSIFVDDRLLESQKHWITCKSRDIEEGLVVRGICFGGSGGLGFDIKGFWRLNAVFFVTISYLFQSFILSNSIVSASLRDDTFVSMVTCFISWVLVIIRDFSTMLCSFTFSYF